MKRAWVKICGTTNYEDAELAWSLNADALGFVFVEGSPRRVNAEQVREIVDRLARPVERIGVVQASSVDEVVKLVEEAGLSGVQLHGDEHPEMVRALRERLPHARLIKGIHVTGGGELGREVARYQECGLDNLLLDSSVMGQSGGTGVRFDWRAAAKSLRDAENRVPLIVAGGLNAENVTEAIEVFHPFGVDVVSGVEKAKGRKDAENMKAFLAAVCRSAEAA